MNIVVLKQEDMKKIFTMEDAIIADKIALEIYSNGDCTIPLRTNLEVLKNNGEALFMPGYAPSVNALGVKIASIYPKNIEKGIPSVPATMLLLNEETGEICCIMDGTYLTRLRTGAISGLATDLLSRKDSKVFALFGTGGQAETQLEAVLTVRKINIVKVFDVIFERAESFALRMSEIFLKKYDVKIIPSKSSEEAIFDADIITSVTTSKKPVFNGKFLKKGCHINGVGSFTKDMQEIDEYTICHAGKIFVDTLDGALNEPGDIIIPIQNGNFSADRITGELGNLISGKIQGRTNDEEITVFKTTGSAILDVVCAKKIYEKALKNSDRNIIEV